LQAVADLFRRNDTWPTLNQIDRPLRAGRIDAVAAIKSMPAGLLVRNIGNADPARQDKVPLTLRGMALCQGTEPDVELFLAVTRWAAAIDTEFDPGDDPHAVARLTSQDVASQFHLGSAASPPLRRLYAMLQVQRWGFGSGGGQPNGWWWDIDREIHRFANVTTAREYDEARAAWTAEATPMRHIGAGTMKQEPDAPSYESESLRIYDTRMLGSDTLPPEPGTELPDVSIDPGASFLSGSPSSSTAWPEADYGFADPLEASEPDDDTEADNPERPS
jgi:hypothetical protein